MVAKDRGQKLTLRGQLLYTRNEVVAIGAIAFAAGIAVGAGLAMLVMVAS